MNGRKITPTNYKVGQKVKHIHFGHGEVTGIIRDLQIGVLLQIQFKDYPWEVKKILDNADYFMEVPNGKRT